MRLRTGSALGLVLERADCGLRSCLGSLAGLVGEDVGRKAELAKLVASGLAGSFGGAASGLFAGTVSGGGSLIKTGTGTLTLTGNQLDSGLFSINQGTVALNGTYGGDMTVAPGAALRATGNILGSLTLSGTLFAVPTSTSEKLRKSYEATAGSWSERRGLASAPVPSAL